MTKHGPINMCNFHKIISSVTLFFGLLLSQHTLANFTTLTTFGDNPGELSASYYTPSEQPINLVVLLHGCVQSGETLAQQSGLLALAKQHNFALLMPQQNQNNNIKNCFNWFSEQDTNKNSGENLSIKNMITTLHTKLNSQNTYVLGLSAGGAMTSSLLVNYPELFHAGAVIAGLPYPCANNLIKAISCMRGGPSQTAQELSQQVLALQRNKKQDWPKLSVWTGSNDQVVNPKNAQVLAEHWAQLSLHNGSKKAEVKQQPNYQISQWKNAQNQVQVELIELENIGHGIAINSQQENGGSAADFLLAAPLSAAIHIIDFWKINNQTIDK